MENGGALMEKERHDLEYKEKVNRTYLKTVSAFANYDGGDIVFGVSDDLRVVGLADQDAAAILIESQINDCLKPRPDCRLLKKGDGTILLHVDPGDDTPYLYEGKSYKRYDTSTVQVSDLELKRLILKGENKNYEELPCGKDNLTFEAVSNTLKEKLKIAEFNVDSLKSLMLYSESKGYNNAAYLLADHNDGPGIDIVVFGESENIFKRRETLAGVSLISQYYESLKVFEQTYGYEEIREGFRSKAYSIPYEAFREALANALIHRVYDVKANIKVAMHPDAIIISSPGGLPDGVSEEEYKKGRITILRNPIIAGVFFRASIIEAYATGIKRIRNAYAFANQKPIFDITRESIEVTLPVLKQPQLSREEKELLSHFSSFGAYRREELERNSGLSKDTLIRTLNSLIKKGLISKDGEARATTYRLSQ